jgi:DNA mismatch repair protein MutH
VSELSEPRARKTRALDRRGSEPAPAAPPFATVEPSSEAELMTRARALSGWTVAELAARAKLALPVELRHAKGLIGCLVERALGAHGGQRAGPDFPALGIELKTIPLAADGRPRESTFVCTISLRTVADTQWERSAVRKKLARVLWIPIESDRSLTLGARRIGAPRLWSPTSAQEALLRADWEDLVGVIGRGDVELLDARAGRCLQVRPKARTGHERGRGIDERGAPTRTLPRGFYLRARFTAQLFA